MHVYYNIPMEGPPLLGKQTLNFHRNIGVAQRLCAAVEQLLTIEYFSCSIQMDDHVLFFFKG